MRRRDLLKSAAALGVAALGRDLLTPTRALAQSFSPPQVSGLQLWLKADAGVFKDAGVTPCGNGDTVQQWNDQSGNGNHATQSAAGNRPTYATAVLNGLAVLTFDGSTSYLNNAYLGELNTVFVVHRHQTTTYAEILGADTSNHSYDLGAYYLSVNTGYGVTTPAHQRIYNRTSSADATPGGGAPAAWQASSVPVLANWDVFGATNDGTTISLYKSGFLCSTSTIPNGATAVPISAAVIGAGYYNRNVVDFLNGQIAEIIVYNAKIAAGDFRNVVNYLIGKWGLLADGSVLFSSFLGPGPVAFHNRLYLFRSRDGVNFKYLPCNYVPTNDTHGVRDPSLVGPWQSANLGGKWWLCHSDIDPSSYAGTDFAVANSVDGFAFAPVTTVNCASLGATYVWAPSWFIDGDGSVHVIFAAGSGSGGMSLYEVHPTNAAMTSWSSITQLTGTSLPSQIDPFMVKIGSTYNCWYANLPSSSTESIELMTSASLTSGYTVAQSGNWAGWGTGQREGDAVINVDGTTIVYLDQDGNGYLYSKNANGYAAGSWAAAAGIGDPCAYGKHI